MAKVVQSELIKKIIADRRNFPSINIAISKLKSGTPLTGDFYVNGVKKEIGLRVVPFPR